jgi:hypothetical protein
VRPSLKAEFRKLNGRSYTFYQLWPKVQDMMVRNFVWLPCDFNTNDLWFYARKRGWIRESPRGRLTVTVR